MDGVVEDVVRGTRRARFTLSRGIWIKGGANDDSAISSRVICLKALFGILRSPGGLKDHCFEQFRCGGKPKRAARSHCLGSKVSFSAFTAQVERGRCFTSAGVLGDERNSGISDDVADVSIAVFIANAAFGEGWTTVLRPESERLSKSTPKSKTLSRRNDNTLSVFHVFYLL